MNLSVSQSPMNLANYQERVIRVCFSRSPDDADLSALGNKERWLTYRVMVRARLRKVVQAAFPRTAAHLGDSFDHHLSEWLAIAPPASPLFRVLPDQFCDFVRNGLDAPTRSLIDFERVVWDLKSCQETPLPAVTELSFERPIVLHPATKLVRTEHLVHRPSPDALKAGTWDLLVYRTPDFRVVSLKLNPVARALVQAWMSPHDSLASAVREAAASEKVGMGATFMDSLGGLLADYTERGIIRGSQALASV